MDDWKASEVAAGASGITAPAWVFVLQDINVVLATVSSLLTIGFVLWRWRRSARHNQ